MHIELVSPETYFWIKIIHELYDKILDFINNRTILEFREKLKALQGRTLLLDRSFNVIDTHPDIRDIIEFLSYNGKCTLKYALSLCCSYSMIGNYTMCIEKSMLDVQYTSDCLRYKIPKSFMYRSIRSNYREYIKNKKSGIKDVCILVR